MRRNDSNGHPAWNYLGVGGTVSVVIIAGLVIYFQRTPTTTVKPAESTELERLLAHEKLLANRALAAVEHQRIEVEQLREHLASLEDRLAEQRSLPSSGPGAEAQRPDAESEDEPPHGAPAPELGTEEIEARDREIEQAEVEAGRDFHTEVFEDQSRDADWAADEEARVSQLFAGEAFEGSRLDSIECRTTRCRLVFAHDDAMGHRRLMGRGGWELFRYGGFVSTDPGTNVTTAYIGRQGHNFAQAALHRPGEL